MTLEAHLWGNPETILMNKQNAQLKKVAACGDCIHASMIFKGKPYCTVKYQKFGYRCINYTKATND